MKHVVVVADRVNEAGLKLLRANAEIEVVDAIGNAEALAAALPRAHALLVRSATKVTAEMFDAAPGLKVVGRAGIGVDNIDVDAATQHGIAVLNAPGGNTVSAAEHTIALLLSLIRRIPWAVETMRRGEWDRKKFSGTELRGKTYGVVGLGRIGSHVAGLARAFGMEVVAHDPFVPERRAKELRVELLPLDDLLARADVVTLHMPLTDETRGLIDRRRLGLMKKTAVLVNTARGGLVDEAALVEALNAGTIAGAAVDVYSAEPLPADAPLRHAENVILTPHLAASTAEAQARVAVEICRAVLAALTTGDVGGAVNVPGLSGEAMVRLRPLLDLARRVGRLAAAVALGRVQAIEVQYGGPDEDAPRPATLAAVEGALSAMGVGPVSIVNAAARAEERGIAVARRSGAPLKGFETTLGVALQAGKRSTVVVGALLGDRIRVGRIVRIDDYPVDVPADGAILVLRNRDVPGVVGRVGMVLGEAEMNVASYHQSRSSKAGADALAAIVVDHPPEAGVLQRLEALPDVTEVRFAPLDGTD